MVPHLIIMFKLILMCLLMERRSTKPNSDAWQRPVHLCLGHSFLVEDGLVGTSKSGLGQSEIPVASPLACQLMMEKWISLAREHSEAFSAFLGEHFQRTQDSYFLLMSALLSTRLTLLKVSVVERQGISGVRCSPSSSWIILRSLILAWGDEQAHRVSLDVSMASRS